jgi:hypothetical protein
MESSGNDEQCEELEATKARFIFDEKCPGEVLLAVPSGAVTVPRMPSSKSLFGCSLVRQTHAYIWYTPEGQTLRIVVAEYHGREDHRVLFDKFPQKIMRFF